jgi:hypothetical protein
MSENKGDCRNREETIKEYEKEIEKILEQRPGLKKYQDEIKRRLSKAPDYNSKMSILNFMLLENALELGNQCNKLLKLSNEQNNN